MKKFYPYFGYLSGVRSTFIAGVTAGIIFAVASGFGFPLMVKTVFPVIFGKTERIIEVREAIGKSMGPQDADELLNRAFEDEMATFRKTEELRRYFATKVGEENAPGPSSSRPVPSFRWPPSSAASRAS